MAEKHNPVQAKIQQKVGPTRFLLHEASILNVESVYASVTASFGLLRSLFN